MAMSLDFVPVRARSVGAALPSSARARSSDVEDPDRLAAAVERATDAVLRS
jgi:hypothetical protein